MSAEQISVGVAGAAGRMGQTIIGLAWDDPAIRICAAIEAPGHDLLGTQVGETQYSLASETDFSALDVLIDFSLPASVAQHAALAAAAGCRLVIGTTGLDQDQLDAVAAAAEKVAVLHAPNMSLGVNLLFMLTAKAAAMLPDWDAEILELHHRHKLDAPSGTAVRLGEIIQSTRPDSAFSHDRSQRREPRPDNEIGYAVLRAGDAVGEHTVLLGSTGERIELTHRATSRATFAAGALAAAKHIAGQKPGRCSMDDVLAARLKDTA